MFATILNLDNLSPDTHRQIHEVIKEEKGILWANVLVGRPHNTQQNELVSFEEALEKTKETSQLDIVFEDTFDSLDDGLCIKCSREIKEHEQLHSLYEYEDGDPAFYLCKQCDPKDVLEVNIQKTKKDDNNNKG